jgi:pyroglutamyl-peptidase
MAKLRVLLTGFGPFPGVPDNPSARLAEALAACSPALDCELHSQVLPTEWETVAALVSALHETLQPHVIIHFGVSEHSKAFRIERSAHNRTAPRPDAKGALPSNAVVLAHRPDRLDTRLPAAVLAAHLRAQGFAATTSQSAGSYLCNFLYYLSLDWGARQETPPLALFVHIPHASAQGGPFTEVELLHGAQELLRLVLAFADAGIPEGRTGAEPASDEADLLCKEDAGRSRSDGERRRLQQARHLRQFELAGWWHLRRGGIA